MTSGVRFVGLEEIMHIDIYFVCNNFENLQHIAPSPSILK